MEDEWFHTAAEYYDGVIPPLPTREEELAYLDKLEKELRNQSYFDSGYPPDPARRYIRECAKIERIEKAKKRSFFVLSGIAFSPLSF
jgi:hypothetical protein